MCLFGDMGKCKGPCIGNITNEEYLNIIDEVVDFLNGKNGRVKKLLTEKMNEMAELQDFEQAIVYRNQLEMIEKSDRYILSNLAFSTFNIFPRRGKIACSARFLAVFGEPPAESPSTIYIAQFF